MTGTSTGPGAAIPGNVTNPTNATNSPSAVGGGNMTSPSTAKAANQTASMQSGGKDWIRELHKFLFSFLSSDLSPLS